MERRASFFLWVSATVAIVTLALIALFDYAVDPANLFHAREFADSFSKALLSGHNVEVDEYEDRLANRYIIERLKARPDVIMVGSSRHQLVRGDWFKPRTFRNNSVTGGSLEDAFSTWSDYEKRGWMPPVVILGADPWYLSGTDYNRRSTDEEYHDLAQRLGVLDDLEALRPRRETELRQYRELISMVYFRRALPRWRILFDAAARAGITPFRSGYLTVWRPDGSKTYDKRQRDMGADGVRSRALAEADGNFPGGPLNPHSEKALRAFVAYLRGKGVTVIFFLTPYHPLTYRHYMDSPQQRVLADIERRFHEIGAEYGVPVVGTYDPAKVGCTDADFYDAQHAKEGCVRAALTGQRGTESFDSQAGPQEGAAINPPPVRALPPLPWPFLSRSTQKPTQAAFSDEF